MPLCCIIFVLIPSYTRAHTCEPSISRPMNFMHTLADSCEKIFRWNGYFYYIKSLFSLQKNVCCMSTLTWWNMYLLSIDLPTVIHKYMFSYEYEEKWISRTFWSSNGSPNAVSSTAWNLIGFWHTLKQWKKYPYTAKKKKWTKNNSPGTKHHVAVEKIYTGILAY